MRVRSNGCVYRTKSEWAEILERYRVSGLGVQEFCKLEGVASSTFGKWLNKVSNGESGGSTEPSFVEVTGSLGQCRELYEVELRGGRKIRVPSRFNAVVLGELIRAVERC